MANKLIVQLVLVAMSTIAVALPLAHYRKQGQISSFEQYFSHDVILRDQNFSIDEATQFKPETKKFTAAPLPTNAKPPENLPGKSYYRGQVATDVYWVAKTGYCGMFIVTNSSVVVVDAPPLIGQDFLDAIKGVTNLSVTHLIYSHFHIDHIGSATIFENAEIIAHVETAKFLQKRNDTQRPVPTKTFEDTLTLQIGGKTIQLDYKGPIHTPGNIFVWLPEEKVLFSCDIMNTGWAPFTRLGVAEDVVAYLGSFDIMLSYPFQSFVAGHWGKLGTRQDVTDVKEYMADVQRNSIAGAKAINTTAIADQMTDPSNVGLFIELIFRAQIRTCVELTVPKWLPRLGGVDIYTESNCDAITMAQDIDYGQNVIT